MNLNKGEKEFLCLCVCVYKTEREHDRWVEQQWVEEKKESDSRDSFSVH